jgi:hypothetical protein
MTLPGGLPYGRGASIQIIPAFHPKTGYVLKGLRIRFGLGLFFEAVKGSRIDLQNL